MYEFFNSNQLLVVGTTLLSFAVMMLCILCMHALAALSLKKKGYNDPIARLDQLNVSLVGCIKITMYPAKVLSGFLLVSFMISFAIVVVSIGTIVFATM